MSRHSGGMQFRVDPDDLQHRNHVLEQTPSDTGASGQLIIGGSKKSIVYNDLEPAEKLKVLLEITNRLANTLELEQLLPRVVEDLMEIFRQADRAPSSLGPCARCLS